MEIGRVPANPRIAYKSGSEVKKQDSGAADTGSAGRSEKTESQLLPEAGVYEKSAAHAPEQLTYQPVKKKLTSDEVQAIKEQQEVTRSEMIRQFIQDTIDAQNRLLGRTVKSSGESGVETGDHSEPVNPADELAASNRFLTSIFGSMEQAYPPIDQTPEGAAKALEEGGAYSAGAVAERIMTMAVYVAGNDPERLKQMRDSVIKGFEQAGAAIQSATQGGLPPISQETYNEIMRRFDAMIADAGQQPSVNDEGSNVSPNE